MSAARSTYVTPQQAAIHALFEQTRSMSVVARALRISQIRVREALVQWQRNRMRDLGLSPPPLREMMRGDVTTRFGVPRSELNGRPAKHSQDALIGGHVAQMGVATAKVTDREIPAPTSGVRRIILTAAESGARTHLPFWNNLLAYSKKLGAEIVVARLGEVGLYDQYAEGLRERLADASIRVGDAVGVVGDRKASLYSSRPLDALKLPRNVEWSLVPHWAIQLETRPRLRSEGLRVAMTTGAVTLPRAGMAGAERQEVGATLVEIASDGAAHCRHLLAEVGGDGSFQDIGHRVRNGSVMPGCRVEAITFGDIHHSHLDAKVAAATWGIGARAGRSLIDVLRPRSMLYHDVVDFESRNHHDARDHLKRFAQMAAGGGDVCQELTAAARFLSRTSRTGSRSIVVGSNHDSALLRWLGEADFRQDPTNAVFFLRASLALHLRLKAGRPADGIFEQILRSLVPDGLRGVRFLKPSETHAIAGIECSIHGHRGADGKRGDMRFFERLGIRATLGHIHRPTTRGDIYSAGVCQPNLHYARGPLTAWATGHVVTYSTGARQHLLFNRGRFFSPD